MTEILKLLNAAALLLTVLPMLTTAIVFLLAFRKMDYGYVGTRLTWGFMCLTLSALISAFNQLTEMNLWIVLTSQCVRFIGACCIAFGAVGLYKDVDENVP